MPRTRLTTGNPWENLRELAGLGILGMAVPEEYGGLGLPVLDTALVLEEIAKVCCVTAMAVLGEVGVQTKIVSAFAPDSLKRRILPAVCSADMILAVCMTEPHAGTDGASFRTQSSCSTEPKPCLGRRGQPRTPPGAAPPGPHPWRECPVACSRRWSGRI